MMVSPYAKRLLQSSGKLFLKRESPTGQPAACVCFYVCMTASFASTGQQLRHSRPTCFAAQKHRPARWRIAFALHCKPCLKSCGFGAPRAAQRGTAARPVSAAAVDKASRGATEGAVGDDAKTAIVPTKTSRVAVKANSSAVARADLTAISSLIQVELAQRTSQLVLSGNTPLRLMGMQLHRYC